jgi:co-chaperonin GroES (HSP10)
MLNKGCNGCNTSSEMLEIIKKFEIPFVCIKCGGFLFPYKAVLDRVFLYPQKTPAKIGSIFLTETYRASKEQEIGVILSVGPGYYNKKGVFISVDDFKGGDVVIYDKQVPWVHWVKWNGRTYKVKIMGHRDVKCLYLK